MCALSACAAVLREAALQKRAPNARGAAIVHRTWFHRTGWMSPRHRARECADSFLLYHETSAPPVLTVSQSRRSLSHS